MRMKQGDLFPFEYNLTYDDNTPIDLTGATVAITMTLDDEETPIVNDESCTVVTASEGKINYQWQSGETDDIGMYRIEFHITFNSGATLTVPSGDVLWMFIVPSLRTVVVPP